MRNSGLIPTFGLATTILLCAGSNADASVTLQLTDYTSKAMNGFVANIPGTPDLNSSELIGIYKFSAADGFNGGTLWSTCLSPGGVLNTGSYTYDQVDFGIGSPGKNPAAWASGDTGDAGIQNAQYLWRLYSPDIIASGTKQQGAGLAMAMYEALYDSTAYGSAGAFGDGNFSVSTWAGGSGVGSAYSWASQYLSGLSFAAVSANLAGGDILRSSASGAGQDLIFNVTPVPEPTTMIAGALLLLPFGASTLRILRRNRAA